MRNKHKTIILIGAAFLILNNAYAQDEKRLELQYSTGIDVPVKKLGGVPLKPGFGFEASVSYPICYVLKAYAGWGWNTFSEDKDAGTRLNFDEKGYSAGLQLTCPVMYRRFHYFVRGGFLYKHVETQQFNGDLIDKGTLKPGWQLDAGGSTPVSKRISLSSFMGFQSQAARINTGAGSIDASLKYLIIGGAIKWTF